MPWEACQRQDMVGCWSPTDQRTQFAWGIMADLFISKGMPGHLELDLMRYLLSSLVMMCCLDTAMLEQQTPRSKVGDAYAPSWEP